jgi:hypothetical protein
LVRFAPSAMDGGGDSIRLYSIQFNFVPFNIHARARAWETMTFWEREWLDMFRSDEFDF